MDIPTIMRILGNADPGAFFQEPTKEQNEADDALDRKDRAAIFDELLPYLNHPNPVVRNRVIQKLGESKRPEAYPYLVDKLHNDPLTSIRYITIFALVNLGDRRACTEFSNLLKENQFGIDEPGFTSQNIRNRAQWGIGKLGCNH
jgi:HEAT repeat protein